MKSSNHKPSLWKLLNDAGGFSLAEVMVAAGILGILSLAITEMTSNIAKSQRTMEQKFELGSIMSDVEFALRSRIACERTLAGRVVSQAGNTFDEIRDSSTQNRVLLSSVAGAIGNTLGNNANGFTVTEIRLLGFVDEGVSPTDPNYIGNTSGTHYDVVNTIDTSGAAVTRRDGLALVRVTFTKGFAGQAGRTEEQQADFQRLTATGSNITVHNFRVRVMTDTSNAVVSCQSGDTQILQAACASLGGLYTPGDGRCREIEIFEDPTDADSIYAIKSRNSIKVIGGVAIGSTDGSYADNVVPPAGSLQVQTTATIGGDASVGGTGTITGNVNALANVGIGGNAVAAHRLRVMGGTSRFDEAVGIGDAPLAGHMLRVVGDATVSANVGIGAAANPAFRLSVIGGASTFQHGNSQVNINAQLNSNNRINLNPTVGIFQEMGKGASPRVRIEDTGEITISNSNVDTAPRIEIGGVSSELSTYRPIRVYNQPINVGTATTSSFRAINTEIDAELTTKAWVRRMVFGTMWENNSTRITEVIGNMANFAQHQTWNAVAAGICNNLRVRNVGVSPTSYTTCNFNGSTCDCAVRDCSSAGTACNNLYTGTLTTSGAATVGGNLSVAGAITSSGRIYSASFITAGSYVSAGTAVVAGSYMQAGSYMVAGTFVQAPKIRATSDNAAGGAGGVGGICGTLGCATRFGKQHCPSQGVVVGIHRGTIACGIQNLSGGGTVVWPTFAN